MITAQTTNAPSRFSISTTTTSLVIPQNVEITDGYYFPRISLSERREIQSNSISMIKKMHKERESKAQEALVAQLLVDKQPSANTLFNQFKKRYIKQISSPQLDNTSSNQTINPSSFHKRQEQLNNQTKVLRKYPQRVTLSYYRNLSKDQLLQNSTTLIKRQGQTFIDVKAYTSRIADKSFTDDDLIQFKQSISDKRTKDNVTNSLVQENDKIIRKNDQEKMQQKLTFASVKKESKHNSRSVIQSLKNSNHDKQSEACTPLSSGQCSPALSIHSPRANSICLYNMSTNSRQSSLRKKNPEEKPLFNFNSLMGYDKTDHSQNGAQSIINESAQQNNVQNSQQQEDKFLIYLIQKQTNIKMKLMEQRKKFIEEASQRKLRELGEEDVVEYRDISYFQKTCTTTSLLTKHSIIYIDPQTGKHITLQGRSSVHVIKHLQQLPKEISRGKDQLPAEEDIEFMEEL